MSQATVLITGASSGIGYEFAKLFAADKHGLVLVSLDGAGLRRVQGELRKKYQIEVKIMTQDLTESDGPEKIFARLREQKIGVDILVNDAGFGLVGPFAELDKDKQLSMIDLNVRALTALTKLFLAQTPKKNAKILNVSSLAAFQPGPFMAVYYATKAYVLSFSEALAEELSEQKITVTALCPGPVDTNFWKMAHPWTRPAHSFLIDNLSAAEVARAGYIGLMAGRRVVIPGSRDKIIVSLNRLLPRKTAAKIAKSVHKNDPFFKKNKLR